MLSLNRFAIHSNYCILSNLFLAISVILSCSDPNKITVVCSLVKTLWSTVRSVTKAANATDSTPASKPCVHIPHIEQEMSLLLSCLLQKV